MFILHKPKLLHIYWRDENDLVYVSKRLEPLLICIAQGDICVSVLNRLKFSVSVS